MTPRAQVAEPSTELATLDDYERVGGFNVLHPVVHLKNPEAISEVLTPSFSEVRIVPDVDTYNDFVYANERDGKHALSALGIGKLLAAAGVRWIEPCVIEARERRPDGHVYVRVRATGAVLQPNGEAFLISAHKEIDTQDLAEQYANAIRKKAVREKKSVTDAEVEAQVRERVLQVREHVLSLAETKAQNRVGRKLLSLRQVYTTAELQRPFVVPRLLVRPDLNDPVMRATAQIEGARAAEQAYGSLPAATAPQDPSAMGVPPLESNVPAVGPETDPPAGTNADATATERVDSGGKAPAGRGRGTSRKTVRGKDGPPADPAPSATTEIPSDDPYFTQGPHKGQRFSEVADADPQYLRDIVSGKITPVTAKVKQLAQEWIDWVFPSMRTDA